MTLGDKLSKLRKENNYTQEQLASILGVSRQSISKWESNSAYPETDKMIRISELFNCSLDYLLKDEIEIETEKSINVMEILFKKRFRERKSEKQIFGMPLWHIGKNARGFIAIGLHSRGVIAIGMKAKGIVSLGLLSMGLISLGMFSVGLLSIGVFALGLLSAGCCSVGLFATGAISLGIISLGALAIGDFSVGALAIGKYFALGDNAHAMIAIGDTKAVGSVFEKIGELTSDDMNTIRELLDTNVPRILQWAKDMVIHFIG